MAASCLRKLASVLRPQTLQWLLRPHCIARASSSYQPRVKVTSVPLITQDDSLSGRRPIEVCASMRQVKTSPMKLGLVAKLIRGMSITDALSQMKFCEKKAANFVETTILDAQRRAEEAYDLNPVDLYVAESFGRKGKYLKRIRYHGRGKHAIMNKYYSHYFLKLRPGPPPPPKRKKKEDHKSFLTRKLIQAGPRSIPSSL